VTEVRIACVQKGMTGKLSENVESSLELVRMAAARGAQVILLPELFEYYYFPQQEREEFFDLAHPVERHPFLGRFSDLAKELGVVLPVSFFERANCSFFNSLAMFDATGEMLGVYRKSHIPDGPLYEEKYYFTPGDTGFRTWMTKFGGIGVGICWDQWFPECARAMVLDGADILLYPTAIGSEPPEAQAGDTSKMWRSSMVGHAIANSVFVGAANRVGVESDISFYGNSFLCDFRGEIVAQAQAEDNHILVADVNLDEQRRFRAGMGFFRDRRLDLYERLLRR
jgi:N-carbamoylputrescine amidase